MGEVAETLVTTYDDAVAVNARQSTTLICRIDELLVLVPDNRHPRDESAIRVERANGDKVGYVRAKLAQKLLNAINSGDEVECRVAGFVGPIGYWTGLQAVIAVRANPDAPARTCGLRHRRFFRRRILKPLALAMGSMATALTCVWMFLRWRS